MGLIVFLMDSSDDDADRIAEVRSTLAEHAPGVDFTLGTNVNEVDYEAMGSYHNLHLLRGFAMYVEKEGRAASESERMADYPLLRQYYDGAFNIEKFHHLIDHADDSGAYIPAQLDKPINTESDSIGSVHGLLAELNSLREPLWNGADAAFKGPEVLWEYDPRDAFASEKRSWCQLRWMCRNAARYNLVVSFG
ncbi:MAG: hypothetical protein K2Z81_04485 [Cyanobacteria bacterium]|nr:hypothetical protein [Cyanobacteriota bacterium]